MKRKLFFILALLCLTVSSAWADWNGGTYTASADETIDATINVSNDATLTINSGVTVTVNGGIVVADGKTLTITGGGKLVVKGSGGGGGSDGGDGGQGGTGNDAIHGNVIINGVTAEATGGNGGTGGHGGDSDKIAGNGGTGGTGGNAFSGAVTIVSGSVTATGGDGGTGGWGGESNGGYSINEGGNGGGGGQGGHAFAGTLIIYGGSVYATGGNGGGGGGYGYGGEEYPARGGDGGFAFAGTMTFYGGDVSAAGGAGGGYGYGGDDNFNGNTSKAFANAVVFGTLNYGISGSIADDNYVTFSADDAVLVTAKLANGAYWSTFYSETMAYKAPEGTQVFAVKLDGTEITLTEVEDRIVDNSQGVVLKQTTDSSEPTTTIVMVANASASGFDYASNNSLTGTMTSITNPGNAYVLNYKAATGVGFYKLSATGTIAANRAYLTYDGSGSLAREYFGFTETTGIADVRSKMSDVRGDYFDLQGRRVAQPTTGLYIVNGKKVIIK